MKSINVKVAFCTECNGYYAATPAKKEDCNHPEIIDHYFYHGEPHFTLSRKSFEAITQFSNTEIRTVTLSEHQARDHQYCQCSKKAKSLKIVELEAKPKDQSLIIPKEKFELDADIYFTDLYYTYNNFHGLSPASGRSASA